MNKAVLLPRLGEVNLVRDSNAPHIGAAFQLAKPARKPVHWQSGAWSILAQRGSPWLMIRGPGGISEYDEAVRQCVENLQIGLDLVSANVGAHLVVTDINNEHLAWWPTRDGLIVRYVSVDSMMFDASATAILRDTDGNIVQPVASTGPAWHESFRYYRLSQTTSDLFDAYRNAYLALEAILSDVAPQRVRANGGVAEKEGEWFRRALTRADRLYDLRQLTPTPILDPVDYFVRSLYGGTRSAISHAKAGRRVLLPQSASDRAEVREGLNQVLSLYQGIASSRLGVRWPGGWISPSAKTASLAAVFENLQMFASDDETPFEKSETLLNPAGGQLCEMTPRAPVTFEDGMLATQLWDASTASVSKLPFVRRVVTARDGIAMSTSLLADRLFTHGVHRFEALVGLRDCCVTD